MTYLLPHLIDEYATKSPDRECIRFSGQGLTFRQLAERSDCLARVLNDRGVRRRDRVGIFSNKCCESAVAMYGIMKAGAAYVPLDPSASAERLQLMIRDCGIGCIVSQDSKAAAVEALASMSAGLKTVIGVSNGGISWEEVWGTGGPPPDPGTVEQDLAYIIYTSGSTGRPKGIMHTHHSALSFARWAAAAYGLNVDDRLSNHAPLHFDLSIFDFFAGAVAGATTVLIPEPYTKLAASYSQLLADEKITVLFTVPFALIQLVQHGVLEKRDLRCLRWAIFGGEPFPARHLRDLMLRLPWVSFDNMYGPAEVNGCTHYTLPGPPEVTDSIPIGRVNANMEGLVIDGEDKPVEAGAAGELLIRSATMMQGYWSRPDLNAKAFYRRSIADGYEDVFYRTGDLVRIGTDGNYHFLGRKDRQVKTRGYRVELDEVEAALVSHDAVEEAAAYMIKNSTDSENRIEAAVTVEPGGRFEENELLAHTKTALAWYAVPARIVLRQDFPRTTTGKIDRRRLQMEAASLAPANCNTIEPTTNQG